MLYRFLAHSLVISGLRLHNVCGDVISVQLPASLTVATFGMFELTPLCLSQSLVCLPLIDRVVFQ